MRLNENIAVSTPKVLLVPYEARHVLKYHEWMQDPAIREATASDQLSLDEEYENQLSWRASADKLTFIVCEPLSDIRGDADDDNGPDRSENDGGGSESVAAGEVDTPERMIGDVNLFLTPWEEEEEDPDDESENGAVRPQETPAKASGGGYGDSDEENAVYCNGEVDIMIASPDHRGKGLGKAAVAAFLLFVRRNLGGILAEYGGSMHLQSQLHGHAQTQTQAQTQTLPGAAPTPSKNPKLKDMVAKINAENAGSIALFKGLGFRQRGEVNYFGDIELALEGFGDDNSYARETGTAAPVWAAGMTGEEYHEIPPPPSTGTE
ncbi:Uu.00g089650.m01.CDS01 [Anthostomella pinea]|uniref:Uu.00g089650.m01.CDS01 n=1 Tax=Anthostomella pinea TaxID=933095 RepID=A0AAI8VMQ6_9PEZI|nr:Uu.00g089650.m01.CDS01 [Anthostomella pinea]